MTPSDIRAPEIVSKDDDRLDYTDLSVGEILRRTRVHYGQSLVDIEKALRIRASQLEAIETSDMAQLPGRVYAVGFVRSYAEYLNLDGEKMVALFKHQSGVSPVRTPLDFPTPASETRLPPWWLVAACVAVFGIIMVGWWGHHNKRMGLDNLTVENVPPVPGEADIEVLSEDEQLDIAEDPAFSTPQTDLPRSLPSAYEEGGVSEDMNDALDLPSNDQQSPEISDENVPIPAVEADNTILLNLRADSWVEIRDQKGQVIVSKVVKAGEQYYVPDRPDLTLSLGNAAAVDIQIGGQSLSRLGAPGEVLRNIPLDVAYLKRQYAPQPVHADTPE